MGGAPDDINGGGMKVLLLVEPPDARQWGGTNWTNWERRLLGPPIAVDATDRSRAMTGMDKPFVAVVTRLPQPILLDKSRKPGGPRAPV